MDRLCVYCGSSEGRKPTYLDAARTLGQTLADREIGLVYGGGHVGMMGAVADATLDAGGEAYGVMPQALVDREIAHDGLTDLDVVDSMHTRKERMAELSDGFIALPGGFGTLEELMEVLTWAQLGFHRNPCGFLNVADYYTQLVEFFDQQVEEGFVSEKHRNMVVVTDDVEDLLDQFAAYDPPEIKQYITDKGQT
ncbi:TIGR00730 family Rossman fold protein [Haladaptatus halobius]|uniref:LOG family protein n=1 Tax=Haladaptatus halobius TaxID=2884875 RepID=UPI001D09AD04|nr:TIGR00730 family Rossman fold protein [Haladaptatus halobius]